MERVYWPNNTGIQRNDYVPFHEVPIIPIVNQSTAKQGEQLKWGKLIQPIYNFNFLSKLENIFNIYLTIKYVKQNTELKTRLELGIKILFQCEKI